MYENKKFKNDMEQFISVERVFTEEDEKKVFEKINHIEKQKQTAKIAFFPRVLSFVGIGILISIIIGVLVLQDALKDTNKNAEDGPKTENQEPKVEPNNDNEEMNTPVEEQTEPQAPNEYDLTTIAIGDKVGEWVLTNIDSSPQNFTNRSFKATFEGDMTLTGTISYSRIIQNDYQRDGYLFTPNDYSVLPIPIQESKLNPLIFLGGFEDNYNLKVGEKVENVQVRISTFYSSVNPNEPTSYSSIDIFNPEDSNVNFSLSNAPQQYIDNGITLTKFMTDHNDPTVIFAEQAGGIQYGIESSDYSFVLKNGEIILTNGLGVFTVDYDYIDLFLETALNDLLENEAYPNLKSDIEHFMQTGETIEVSEPEPYLIFDKDGVFHIRFLF
ncbi:MAG: hypothetical protein AB2392_15700 [Neobacillus sp.]